MEKKPSHREFRLRPASLNVEARTVDAVLSTEAPVPMPDWERGGMVPEILRMDGVELPENGIMPLLDSHRTASIGNILGTCRNVRVENGELLATLHFSDDPDGEKAWKKVRGGHLRDLSIGYSIESAEFVPEGTNATVAGRAYTGPLRVVTRWAVFEGTLCPIGADQSAKVREGGFFASEKAPVDSVATVTTVPAPGKRAENINQEGNQVEKTETKPTTPPAPAPDLSEVEKRAREEGARMEAARQREIRSICTIPGCEELAETLCADPTVTVEAAQARVLAHIRATKSPTGVKVEAIADERDKFRAAAQDAVELRAGLKVEKPAPGAVELRGMSLLRLAEECLHRSGKPSRFMDPSELVTRAFTTSDFPGILANSANKVLQRAYAESNETWDIWVEIGEGRDFKSMTRPQLSEAPDLALVTENGEENLVAFAEFAPSLTIQTYDAVVRLTRQMVINDDLGAFLRVPAAFGRAAQRKIGDLVYALITNNVAINTTGSSINLFHASHANLMNPAQPLSVDGLTEMRRMARVQTGRNNKTLGLALRYLLVPAALETAAEVVLNSVYYPEKNAGPIYNPFKGKLVPVAEHRLDANSTTAWYGICDNRDVGTVEVAFLNGVRTPVLQESEGSNPDIRKYRVRIDVGVGVRDHRGMFKSAGA